MIDKAGLLSIVFYKFGALLSYGVYVSPQVIKDSFCFLILMYTKVLSRTILTRGPLQPIYNQKDY
jgi:hypothetical protein